MDKKSAIFLAILCTGIFPNALAANDDSAILEIQNLIGKTYDKPNNKVQTQPVVVEGNYAIADWIQGERGGRALLKRENEKWAVMLCAGKGLTNHKDIEHVNIPYKTAILLEKKLLNAEQKVPLKVRNKFDLFGTSKDPIHSMHQGMK